MYLLLPGHPNFNRTEKIILNSESFRSNSCSKMNQTRIYATNTPS